MSPTSDDLPALRVLALVRVGVASHIGLDLRTPEIGVQVPPSRRLEAAVPEAGVNKDRDSRPIKRDAADPAPLGEAGNLNAVPGPARMEAAVQIGLG